MEQIFTPFVRLPNTIMDLMITLLLECSYFVPVAGTL
jgi:hypothetical protein